MQRHSHNKPIQCCSLHNFFSTELNGFTMYMQVHSHLFHVDIVSTQTISPCQIKTSASPHAPAPAIIDQDIQSLNSLSLCFKNKRWSPKCTIMKTSNPLLNASVSWPHVSFQYMKQNKGICANTNTICPALSPSHESPGKMRHSRQRMASISCMVISARPR